MLRRLLSASRFLIAIPALGSLVIAILLMVAGMLNTYHLIAQAFRLSEISLKSSKALILSAIQSADIFLLATACYIIALGLYELFIDEHLPLPHWLEIHDFDALKNKLIVVVITVLAVVFLGQAINWDGSNDLLNFGAAVALVIAALTLFVSRNRQES